MKSKNPVKLITIISTALLLGAIIKIPLNAEFIFMKNGEIIEGTIVSDSANSVMLRTADKKQIKIIRDNIMRILYTKLKMGKVFIQKRDGKAIMAFIVDEDQESYTCRKELYSPEEFNLKRSDVLFMAEKNPSGLQADGDIGTDNVSLTWLAPYGEVRKYNVYIKKGENSKYELADSSKGKNITIKKLESNKSYYLIVTGVDNEDYESSPSNEIKITTANLHPDRPDILSAEKDTPDGAISYRWNPAADPDGKVVKYRIYGTSDNKRELVSEEKGNAYTLKNPDSYNKLELAAVDDHGDESDIEVLPLLKTRYTFALYPGVLIPLEKFGEMADAGYGGMFFFGVKNLFFDGIEAGLGAGFYQASGKDLSSEAKPVYDSFMIMPVLINTGYRIRLNNTFSVMPYFSFGMSYITISYKSTDPVTMVYVEKSKKTLDPTVMAGIEGEYITGEKSAIAVSAGYGMFIEKDGEMPFASLSLAFKYKF